MHVLEIETFGRGGLTHYAYNLSTALVDRGHQVTFITGAGYELAESGSTVNPTPAGLQVIPSIGRASHRFRRLPAFAGSLLRKVEAIYDAFAVAATARRLEPDVIHLHCTNPIVWLYLERLQVIGRPLVATAHVVTPHEPIRFQQKIYRRVHQLGDRIIAHSEFDKGRLVGELAVNPARVEVIPHGEYGFFARGKPMARDVARRALGLEEHHEVALFFGYLREYKGLDVLFEAWPHVAAQRPTARLVVAGDPVQLGPKRRAELERQADQLGVLHRFAYVPFSDVQKYFAAADVLVMPYRRISQSGVLYLALALGVPVVATRVGGLPEMLTDGESALLVPPESPVELASALGQALEAPSLRERLAEGGRRIAKQHSWPHVAEQTEQVFRAVVAPTGRD